MTAVQDFEFDGNSIEAYGLDNMDGAKQRNWLFKELGSIMGFKTLHAPNLIFRALGSTVGKILCVLKTRETTNHGKVVGIRTD